MKSVTGRLTNLLANLKAKYSFIIRMPKNGQKIPRIST
jgi:hypothetical protein